jgi:hypothetical protein
MECLKDIEETSQYLNNFYNLCDTMKVPAEVSVFQFRNCFDHLLIIHLQYIQIAEMVLSKLPSAMQLPETRTSVQPLRESRIANNESDVKGEEITTNETDGDLV